MVPASLAEFEQLVRGGIDAVGVPSVAYGIARGEEILLLGAAGLANKEEQLQATPAIPYSLASVTKPLTSTAVMLLAERGTVAIEAPVNRYLADAKVQSRAGDAELATVRRVADHSAGLPLHYQFYYADEPDERPPMDETIRRYAKTFSPPGERHHYSNLGYGILDTLIERIARRPYAEFMREEVFEPLGMKHASIGAIGDEAVSYGPDGVGYPRYEFDHPGGSAAYASVEDLLAFGQSHLGFGRSILSDTSLRATHEITAPIEGSRGYGFGWGVNEDLFGYRIVQHTGGMGGVNTILRLVPDLGLVIVVLVNGQSDLPFRSADDALAALSPSFRERLTAARETKKPEVEPDPVQSDLWGRWEGFLETHHGTLPLSLDIVAGREAVATLGEAEGPVDELQVQGGRLLGVFDGDVGTEDAGRREYRIHLDLRPREGVLNGAAATITRWEDGGGGAPGKRMGNALSYWVELARPKENLP